MPLAGATWASSPTSSLLNGGRSSICLGATWNVLVDAAPTLPAPSLARTEKVCWPASSDGVVNGDEQGTNGPPSMLHSKLEPGSFALNWKLGVSSSVGPDGPAVIAAAGGVVSTVATVKVRLAADRSGLPAGSVAKTANVCEPSASAAVVKGVLQGVIGPLSTRQLKLEFASSDEKANVGVESFVVPDGPELIVVSGGSLSPPLLGADVTGFVSDVVATSTVHGPWLDGLVMPMKVTRTLSFAFTTPWVLLKIEHSIVRPTSLPQLPTVTPVVTSTTWPLE